MPRSLPSVNSVQQQAVALAAACRRLHARGLLAGAEGNLSLRLGPDDLLVTPSAVDKGTVDANMVLRVHDDGTLRHGQPALHPSGDGDERDSLGRPSSEFEMHRVCYRVRPEVRAIVHAHPPVLTGFATAGNPLPVDVLPELALVAGPVALVPYARAGTPALAAAMSPFLQGHDVFLLANHGVTVLGTSLQDALLRMESVEQAARVLLVAELLGGARPLDPTEAAALARLRTGNE